MPSNVDLISFGRKQWPRRPVVSSRVGAAPAVVEDGVTGYVVDATAWTDRLDELVADPSLRSRRGAAGRERAHKLHEVRRAAEGINAVLTGVVS